MISLESLFSYLFFIFILLSISQHAPLPEQGASQQAYPLLLDTITVLEKSGTTWDFEGESNRRTILGSFDGITKQTGFCITAAPPPPQKPLSNCASQNGEAFSQDAILVLPSGTLQKTKFSIQKQDI